LAHLAQFRVSMIFPSAKSERASRDRPETSSVQTDLQPEKQTTGRGPCPEGKERKSAGRVFCPRALARAVLGPPHDQGALLSPHPGPIPFGRGEGGSSAALWRTEAHRQFLGADAMLSQLEPHGNRCGRKWEASSPRLPQPPRRRRSTTSWTTDSSVAFQLNSGGRTPLNWLVRKGKQR
jgi:hypothetical protein